MAEEIYVSTDIEADGPIPGVYSMLSFASAAFTANKTMLGTFSANLVTLADTQAHPQTEEFWHANPEAWHASRQNCQPPEQAMHSYALINFQIPGKADAFVFT